MAVHTFHADVNVNEDNSNHYLEIQAEWGTTHESSFWNAQNKLIRLNNSNNSGFLGKGSELRGKKIVVKSNAENNTPNPGDETDRIFVSYQINDQQSIREVARYDKDEDEDDYPTIKVVLNFS